MRGKRGSGDQCARWWQVPGMAKHAVATVDEIPAGGRKIVELEGRSVGIFNVAGEFYAIRNTCPHQGGPLCAGVLTGFAISDEPGRYQYLRRGEVIRCLWHGWEFDIKTGMSWVDPKRIRVKRYPVTVQEVRSVYSEDRRCAERSGSLKAAGC